MSTRDLAETVEIGRRILAARDALRLSQGEFAEAARLSRAYISRLERGLIPNPTITDLAQVAEAAQMSVAALVLSRTRARDVVTAAGEDMLAALADEPPEVAASILQTARAAMEIARLARLARSN